MPKWLKQFLCGHCYSPNLYAVRTDKGKRHAYVCCKCGKQVYVD